MHDTVKLIPPAELAANATVSYHYSCSGVFTLLNLHYYKQEKTQEHRQKVKRRSNLRLL